MPRLVRESRSVVDNLPLYHCACVLIYEEMETHTQTTAQQYLYLFIYDVQGYSCTPSEWITHNRLASGPGIIQSPREVTDGLSDHSTPGELLILSDQPTDNHPLSILFSDLEIIETTKVENHDIFWLRHLFTK